MSILANFTIIDLVKTRSTSVATLFGNYLKFNNKTAIELNFAPYVQILINPKEKQFAIRACKSSDPNAVPFSKPKGVQKHPIRICCFAVMDMIRKMGDMSSDENQNWNVPGIYFAEEQAIVYDLNTAYKPAAKGSRAVKRENEYAAQEATE